MKNGLILQNTYTNRLNESTGHLINTELLIQLLLWLVCCVCWIITTKLIVQ